MRVACCLIGCSLLVVGPVLSLSCRTARKRQAHSGSPRIVFDQVCHDFGTVGRGAARNCRFTFCNKGSTPLLVDTVKVPCGCAVATLAEKTYAPGESGTIAVTYTAPVIRSGPAAKQHHLVVRSNDPQNPLTSLTIQAKVIDLIRVDPPELEIAHVNGREDARPISLSSLDGKPFSIISHQSSKGVLDFAYDPNDFGPRHVVRPLLNKDKTEKIGMLKGRVYLALSHPDCGTVVIPFTLTTDHEL